MGVKVGISLLHYGVDVGDFGNRLPKKKKKPSCAGSYRSGSFPLDCWIIWLCAASPEPHPLRLLYTTKRWNSLFVFSFFSFYFFIWGNELSLFVRDGRKKEKRDWNSILFFFQILFDTKRQKFHTQKFKKKWKKKLIENFE